MPLMVRELPSLVTTAGATVSNAVGLIDDAWGLTVYTNSTFTSTACRVEVEPTDTGTNFVILQSGGSDVILTSGVATVISPVPFRQLRLAWSAAEAATSTQSLTKAILT